MCRPAGALARTRALIAVGGLAAMLAGCEPANITAARNQLGRGGAVTVNLTVPIAQDTFAIGDFLAASETTTTASGVAGVTFSPESLAVVVGNHLAFDSVHFDPFVFGYDQMLQTKEVGTSLAFAAPPRSVSGAGGVPAGTSSPLRFDTPAGSHVVSATVDSGQVVRTLTNNTGCNATVAVGVTDSTGAVIVSFDTVAVSTGTTFTDSVSAAGATVSGYASVAASADLGACVPAGGNVGADVTFRPLTLSSVSLQNVNEPFNKTYSALASEGRLQAVDSVVVKSGTFPVTVQNRLPIALQVNLTLNGVTRGGVTLSRMVTVPAAPGNGTPTSSTVSLDMSGATLRPATTLAVVQGSAVASSAVITAAATTDAVTVNGTGNLQVDTLIGRLDPTKTPELAVKVEDDHIFSNGDVDFGDFADAVRGATINDATLDLGLRNTAAAPLRLSNFTVGLALTDGRGNPLRDGTGAIIYLTDSTGAPLTVPIADSGSTTLTIARNASKNAVFEAAGLLNRLVHLVLDDTSAALVAAGTATVGDGQESVIAADDIVETNLGLTIGLDVTLPDSGVVFHRDQVVSGMDLGTADANQLANRIVEAATHSIVENGTPFGVEVEVALAPGNLSGGDPFTAPGHLLLDPITVAAPAVNAQGRVVAPARDSVAVALTGDESRVLFGNQFTAGVRIRIRPGTGASGRGAIRAGDLVIVDAQGAATVRVGGQP